MNYPKAQIPLILRYYRLMDAFSKSDDERDFYLDRLEGFLIFVDLDKDTDVLNSLEKELEKNKDRYCLVPKMTFFEVKKFMEGFVHEKVYDIDTKEKLLDIISAKEARENFLEFIYDNLAELEKWQLYYQERSRVRIIEWLRSFGIRFVFEEDLDLNVEVVEKLKRTLFEKKVSKDLLSARDVLEAKAESYYSNEALNPRPKRGRPPKQIAKVEVEPQFTIDVYTDVPAAVRHFLYIPDITSASSVTFSSRQQFLAGLKGSTRMRVDKKLEDLTQRLEALKILSTQLADQNLLQKNKLPKIFFPTPSVPFKEAKRIVPIEEEEIKVEEAVKEALPKTEEEEKRKRFAIKKVAQIKAKK